MTYNVFGGTLNPTLLLLLLLVQSSQIPGMYSRPGLYYGMLRRVQARLYTSHILITRTSCTCLYTGMQHNNFLMNNFLNKSTLYKLYSNIHVFKIVYVENFD